LRRALPPDRVTTATDTAGPASRALQPSAGGFAESGGVRIAFEVFGEGPETVLLLSPWAILHSRFWKFQVPYLARRFRVVTYDARGNGRSDRPQSPDAYSQRIGAADALAVMDAAGVEDAVVVCHCAPAGTALLLAVEQPERVRGAVLMSPALPITPPLPERTGHHFNAVLDTYEGWAKTNRHYWAQDYRGYLEFFFGRCFDEPHSTKQIEDSVGWGLETTPETLTATLAGLRVDAAGARDLMARVTCPMLVTQSSDDRLIPPDRGAAFAAATGAELVELGPEGHCPNARHPVRFNELIEDFAARAYGRPSRPAPRRAAARGRRRALFVSSPIGLGHAWRDVAIARELRARHPELDIDWLAQPPVTHVLEACGERIHPASAGLANESRHIAAEAGDHELNVFRAWRRMDEILLANFMVFRDVVRAEAYDLWIGDEAWELDYFLHENPSLKSAPYVFLTDFVGWLPMAEGGEEDARLTADHNAEMLGHIAALPGVRDRAIFVGSPEDVVPHAFGDGLPAIRPWVEEHFAFSGYVLGPEAAVPPDRETLRAEFGYGPDERVCIVTVGGSGVGEGLLRRVAGAWPAARERVPGLRMIVVCGPRIDPDVLDAPDGVEIVGYVDRLSRRLAACDVAVTQGGLSTCMELAAAKRPFVYLPLRGHFEQNVHVRHRLERYGAGRPMDLAAATPETLAAAISDAVAVGDAASADVERDGAARAAALIADVL
jgi:pimeloyl-ACP methyl ester carboxylesterase/predicted glycosyltransferase